MKLDIKRSFESPKSPEPAKGFGEAFAKRTANQGAQTPPCVNVRRFRVAEGFLLCESEQLRSIYEGVSFFF